MGSCKVALGIGLAVAALSAGSARAADRCAACHSKLPNASLRQPAVDHLRSTHRDEQIGCAGCHGGHRTDPTARAHLADDFVPRPERQAVPGLCGGCHGDALFIRRFNASLPVDQLALFKTSGHGVAFADGDAQVAVCTSCHGVHGIRRVSDPRSPVAPRNIAGTCGKCHSDAQRMAPYKIRTDQHALWSESVHGKAMAEGNLAAPTCDRCHGSHGATPPAFDSVARVCGHCHSKEAEAFRGSPHARPFERLGFPECEQCHGNHAVARTSEELVGLGADSICGRCHSKGEKAAAGVELLARTFREAHQKADAARAAVAVAERSALAISDAKLALEELHTSELRLANVFHNFDTEKLQRAREDIEGISKRVIQSVDRAKNERAARKPGYAVLAVLILGYLVLLLIKIRRSRVDEPEATP